MFLRADTFAIGEVNVRILLLTHYFTPEQGAPQRRWDALIRGFIAAGHEVEVVAPPPHHPSGDVPREFRRSYRRGSSRLDDCGALVHRVSWLRHRGDIVTRTLDHLVTSRAAFHRAAARVRWGKFVPDVIIATAPAVPTLIAGRVLGWRHRIPVVVEMRDAWPDLVTHTPGLATDTGPIAWLKRQIHQAVSDLQRSGATVVATTEAFAEVLRERGIREVHVIRNGTNPDHFEQVPSRVDDHDELRLLYMGTIGRSQGLELVVQAVDALKRAGAPVHARIIGTGHERRALMRLNDELGFPVEFLPSVPASEVAAHYEWADSTIVSLRDWEPFKWTIPSKLYELLSSGRHITGIVSGEAADILREANAGTVVTPGDLDELVRVWQGFTLDRTPLEVGPQGRNWAREHVAHTSLASRYLELLHEVVADYRTAKSSAAKGSTHV